MKAQRLDIITTLPQTIIETILCLLPIEDAVRTSILSREWRYKWTTIPKLVFSLSTVISLTERRHLSNGKKIFRIERDMRTNDRRSKLLQAIYQVLSLRQGPIQEFTLIMNVQDTKYEIDQIMLDLSTNHTVLKLTLELTGFSLPMSLFELHQLTDLSLNSCKITRVPAFNGFGSLTSLSLEFVCISTECLMQLLSVCPSIKSLKLLTTDDNTFRGLFLVSASTVDTLVQPLFRTFSVMEFFKCLPVIEHLTTSRDISEYRVQVSVPEEISISLIHLKYFCFKEMRVDEPNGWTFLFVLIKCSPNLEKIKLDMLTDGGYCNEKFFTFEDYSDVWLERLNELEVDGFSNFEPEMEFLKFILARSPSLKKVILLTCMDDKNEELEMLTILLSAPRASQVKIIVKNGC
ncbi:hypothetical protein M8C21_023196 [Ambrosia artemisiifolia]|uniref:F-box domain, FBD domain, Leucine-rich repeat domain, L domain-like protein n=1 Tax=Ambrosia artemisiifolia TaxID=4212 RepID=A0AAD5D7I1_AMBAR|nr:hypothetical protein M8C21_023196 [Ambrosia artemisiifolia]